MGEFKILALTVLLLQCAETTSAGPSDNVEGETTDTVSKDYYSLQAILGKRLTGTSEEKAKIVDLLLQLLEEIDLPTLCEVIVNDTKGGSSAFLQVPIKSTKIDVALLNKLSSPVVTETHDNVATPTPISDMVLLAHKEMSAESDISSAISNSGNRQDIAKENNLVPATYKYHRNELRNVEHDPQKQLQAITGDSFIDAKYPEIFTTSNGISDDTDIVSTKEDFPGDKSENKLIHDRSLSIHNLLEKQTDANSKNNLDLTAPFGDLKQLHLGSIDSQFPGVDVNTSPENTNDVKHKNILVRNVDADRPNTQLYSQSLVLGDWMTDDSRFGRNLDKSYMGNGAELKKTDAMNSFENYVEDGDVWSGDDKSEDKIHFSPSKYDTKQRQQKNMYWNKQDDVKQMFTLEQTSPSPMPSNEKSIDSIYSNTSSESQREVDYLEELRSTYKANTQVTNRPTKASERISGANGNSESELMQPEKEIVTMETEYEKLVSDASTEETAAERQEKLSMPLEYSTIEEFVSADNINKVVNSGFTLGQINWLYTSGSTQGSRSTLETTELPYREHFTMTGTNKIPHESIQTSHWDLNTLTTTYKTTDLATQQAVDNNKLSTSSAHLTKESSDILKSGTDKFSINEDNVETFIDIGKELLTTATTIPVKAPIDINSSIPDYQQTSAFVNSTLATGLSELETSLENGNYSFDHSVTAPEVTAGTVPSENPLLNYTSQDHKNDSTTPRIRISPGPVQSTIVHSERSRAIFSTTTSSPKMEANMKVVNTREMKVSFAENNVQMQDSGSNIQEGGALLKNKYQNKDITNGEESIMNISSTTESDFSHALIKEIENHTESANSGNQMQAALTFDTNTDPETKSSQDKFDAQIHTLESNVRGVKSVVSTTEHTEDKRTLASAATEDDTIKTNRQDIHSSTINVSNTPQRTSYYTSTLKPSVASTVASTPEPRLQSKSAMTTTMATVTATQISDKLPTLQTVESLSLKELGQHVPYNQLSNETLDISNTNVKVSHASSTNSTILNQTIQDTARINQIHSDDSTTAVSVSQDVTTFHRADSFSTSPKVVPHQTANYDHLIKPVFIDYGDNSQYSKISTEMTNSHHNPTESSRIISTSNLNQLQSNVLDTDVIFSQMKHIRVQATDNFTEVEWSVHSPTDANNSSVERKVYENKTDEGSIDVTSAEPAVLGSESEVGTLLQKVSRPKTTADNLKMIATKIAQTKANLSEINVNLRKQMELRTPLEHNMEISPLHTNITITIRRDNNVSNDAQISTAKSTASEKLATITVTNDTLDGEVTYTNRGSNITTFIKTTTAIEESVPTESTSFVSTVATNSEGMTLTTGPSIASSKVTTASVTVPTDKINETSTSSVKDSSDIFASLPLGHLKDFRRKTLNDNKTTGKDSSSNVTPKSYNWNRGYDFSQYTLKDIYRNKPNARPYTTDFSDSMGQSKQVQFLDPWKVYNIALANSKVKQYSKEVVDQTGAPEIHLYSDYKFPSVPNDSLLKNYLWKARPWPEHTDNKQPNNEIYNTIFAEKSRPFHIKDTHLSDSVNYQTKFLNKIHGLTDQAKKIRNVNKWGNRFSQGYYGRVFDDPSRFKKPGHLTNWSPLYSQDMINFDMLDQNSQYLKGYSSVQAPKNKHNNLNHDRGLKPSDYFVLNEYQRYKDLMKDLPLYSGPEVGKESQNEIKTGFLDSYPENVNTVTRNPSNNDVTHGVKNETRATLEADETNKWSSDLQPTTHGIPAPNDYKCPGLFGYHKDPYNCQAFFICSWGMAHRVVCPKGTLYNSKEAVCDWAVNVRCPATQDSSVFQYLGNNM